MTVLIVEDSDDQRYLLRRYFELAGCDVIATECAESAIAAYENCRPDLAVVDLVLPGMDGWAFTERLQADRPECAVAIASVLDEGDYPPCGAPMRKPVTREKVRQILSDCVPRWAAA